MIIILSHMSRTDSSPRMAPVGLQNWTQLLVMIKFASPQVTGRRQPWQLNLVWTNGVSGRVAWRTHLASSCAWWMASWNQWNTNSLSHTLKIQWLTAVSGQNPSYMSEKHLPCQQNMVSRPNLHNTPGIVRKSTFAALTFTRTASTSRNMRPIWSWICLNLKLVRISEAPWASPVTIDNSLNTILMLECCCMRLAPLQVERWMLGGDVESQGEYGDLHSPGRDNASILSTPSKRYFAMLQSLLYHTPKLNIVCMLMLAYMHLARCSPRYKIEQQRNRDISAINYVIWTHNTLLTTENDWASER